MTAMLLFVWGATYLMVRVIRREADVARLQSDFVAAVSHEFRSPLTTMRQMAEMLDADRVPADSRRRQYYRVLVRETGRLQRLVETILDFGRMEAGTATYRFADLDAAALVESAVGDVRTQSSTNDRCIEIQAPADAAVLCGDADALRLALRNLIDNAVKYSSPDTPIRVRWGQDRDRVAIDVVDEGVGIAAEEQTAIFRTFVRGRAAEGGRVSGTGVGLAMVQRIVAAHGGDVRLRSETGRGSTFTLVLPAAPRVPAPGNTAAATTGDASIAGAPGAVREV
jgi:signal transduction histidine kinase